MEMVVMMRAYMNYMSRTERILEGAGARALCHPTELRATVPERADVPERIDATRTGRGQDS